MPPARPLLTVLGILSCHVRLGLRAPEGQVCSGRTGIQTLVKLAGPGRAGGGPWSRRPPQCRCVAEGCRAGRWGSDCSEACAVSGAPHPCPCPESAAAPHRPPPCCGSVAPETASSGRPRDAVRSVVRPLRGPEDGRIRQASLGPGPGPGTQRQDLAPRSRRGPACAALPPCGPSPSLADWCLWLHPQAESR